MSKPTIIVTGATGQLASEIAVLSAGYPDYKFIFLSREELPVHDAAAVEKCFLSLQPQYCINCAAYTAVDKAETDKEMAFYVNGDAPGVLARICKVFNTKLLHLSTDYVFNGSSAVPYVETDTVNPINTYGASKLMGERQATENNASTVIIRTSWVYSSFGNNFVKTMMRLMKERESIQVVNDQTGSPTYAADLAAVILKIIESGKWVPGIYHYSNEGVITWFDFAAAIKEITANSCIIHPIPSSSYPTPARRPDYSVFDKQKIRHTYQVLIPAWKDSLEKCISLMK